MHRSYQESYCGTNSIDINYRIDNYSINVHVKYFIENVIRI